MVLLESVVHPTRGGRYMSHRPRRQIRAWTQALREQGHDPSDDADWVACQYDAWQLITLLRQKANGLESTLAETEETQN